MKYESLLHRIEANSEKSLESFYQGTPCWIWQRGFRGGRGETYGVLNVREEGKVKHLAAHRAAVIASGRTLRKSQVVRHLCNNTLCVNPSHLRGGTQSQNVKDSIKAGNHVGFHNRKLKGSE